MSSVDENSIQRGPDQGSSSHVPYAAKAYPDKSFVVRHVALLLRVAAVVSIISGLIGGYVWLVALVDRSDGDSLRHGFFHNPFMQFPPVHEPFLDLSLWVLLACSAAIGFGGLMLLAPLKVGVPFVTWQARVSIFFNGVIAFLIAKHLWEEWHNCGAAEALLLRLGSIAVDLTLWTFLRSRAVRTFWQQQPHSPERAFEVI